MPYEQPEEPTRKSVSEKQLAANRANAAKSTGPTTPEGRARSAQNSCKHGFTASKFVVLAVEDAQDLENLKANIIHTYQPINAMELLTCERIAQTFFTMQRAAQFEAGMFTRFLNVALHREDNLDEELSEKLVPNSGQAEAFVMAEGFHFQNRSLDFSLLLRYKAQAERDYRRAVEEFERLRKLRPQLAEFPNEAILDEEAPKEENPSPDPNPESPVAASPNEPISASPVPAPDSVPPIPSVSQEKTCQSPHSLVRVERTLPPDSCQQSTFPQPPLPHR